MSQSGIWTPRVPAPGAGGVEVKGGGAPASWTTRETAVEAEATQTRVAAEAEAGKTTGPTPFGTPEGEGGLRPAYREGRERQMSEGDTKTPLSSSERRGEEGLKLKIKTVKIVKIIIAPLMDAIAVTSAVLMSFIFPSSLMKYLMILDEFPAEFVEIIYLVALMVALSTWALTSFLDDLKIRLRKLQDSSETGDEVRRR